MEGNTAPVSDVRDTDALQEPASIHRPGRQVFKARPALYFSFVFLVLWIAQSILDDTEYSFLPRGTYLLFEFLWLIFLYWGTFFQGNTTFSLLAYAGQRVTDTLDGYSERPYPAGQFDFSKEDALGFARMWAKNIHVYTVQTDEGVTICFGTFPVRFRLFRSRNTRKYTSVTLAFEGSISVFIAARHYRKYREELTFDRLCASVADVMMEFMTFYKNKQTYRIGHRLFLHKNC